MRANCWMGKKDVRVEEVPDPRILNAHDAIVRVTSTTICGSDLHLYNGFIPTMKKGDILGHEFMARSSKPAPTSGACASGIASSSPFRSRAARASRARRRCSRCARTPIPMPGSPRS